MKKVFVIIIMLLCFCAASYAAESAFDGILKYDKPKKWDHSKFPRERWLGPDPTFVLEKGYGDEITVTHYGLEDSDFKTPEEFEAHVNGLFSGEKKEVKTLTISGRKAKSIILRYEREEYEDRDGITMPPSFTYDQFVILPLTKGFIVFNLSIRRMFPVPALLGDDRKGTLGIDKEVIAVLNEWDLFLKSCKINKNL